MSYRIKTVSDVTGIPKNTLVAWERRYGLLNPKRAANGYRTYSDRDIAVIRQLKSLLADGYKISEAVELVQSRPQPADQPLVADQAGDAFRRVRDDLLGALLEYRRSDADAVVARVANSPVVQTIRNVFFPVLREVGDRWEAGKVSVAQEHYASAFIRDQLSSMLLHTGCGPDNGVHVACATLPGERHELGLLGLAVHLAGGGFRVTYLGADLPLEDLCNFVVAQAPRWVCISAIQPAEQNDLRSALRHLSECFPEGTQILLGGSPANAPLCSAFPRVTFVNDWFAMRLDSSGAVQLA